MQYTFEMIFMFNKMKCNTVFTLMNLIALQNDKREN